MDHLKAARDVCLKTAREVVDLLKSVEEMEKNPLAKMQAGQMILTAVKSRYGDVAGRISIAEDQLKAAESVVAMIESGKEPPSA